MSFPLVEATLKMLFWYTVNLYHNISFNVLNILQWIFSLGDKKELWSVVHLHEPVFCQKKADQKVSRIGVDSSKILQDV